MKRSATKPTANVHPQMSAYAATDTSMEPDVVSSLALGSSRSAALPHLSTIAPATSSGPRTRRAPVRGGGAGAEPAGSGAGGAGIGGTAGHRPGRSIALQSGSGG